MSESDANDDTWEEFYGTSSDLMPSIMGVFDAIILHNSDDQNEADCKSSPKRSHQAGNFVNLSPFVQKLLSNVPDQEISKNFHSEGNVSRKLLSAQRYQRSFRSPEKHLNKSSESLSLNVQKMISNLPDADLVIPTVQKTDRNNSFLHHKNYSSSAVGKGADSDNITINGTNRREEGGSGKTVVYHSNGATENNYMSSDCDTKLSGAETNNCDNGDLNGDYCNYSPKPLGSYLHKSPQGIASRVPVGRKNLKFLQIPSESSAGTNSTVSSEVSRPVSLTSLGSCSSSGSSGPNQPSSAYLASAESLYSDPEPTGSQGSADSGIAEQMTICPEARVLQEVLDTESVYVADLNEVIEGYLERWESESDSPLKEYLPDLFSNIREVYKFNRSFLDQLRAADCNPTKTANVFIQNDSGFVVYNEYCTNYPRTMDVLKKLTGDDNMTALVREKQVALGHALPLGSYLLKPVQRILKYHLLLQRLSKQCAPGHKPAVDLALTTMTSVASGINNMKRKHEHDMRVHEIQSQLYGWTGPDLTTLGELIAEGTFSVTGAKGRRHVFLFDKVLLMAKSKDSALAYKLHVMCSNLMLVEQVRGEPLSFQVLPFDDPRSQCTLRARSNQHKREWTLQIKRVILENYSAVIPNHARQLVMQLGQDVQENEDTTEKWSLNNKHSTPHYLERRSRVRKSRDLSNRRASSQDRSFASLGNWRRKSEPGIVSALIPQYNSKTVPKKISKLKKIKDGGAKFYMNLTDDLETSGANESNDSLTPNASHVSIDSVDSVSIQSDVLLDVEPIKETEKTAEKNLEKIVSDLLMQNPDYHKIMNRQRRNVRSSEPEPNVWRMDHREKVSTKADSLPRSFQLNDQIGGSNFEANTEKSNNFCESLKENDDDDEHHENDLASQLDDNDYPVHKIYRKSGIRLSLVQRIRSIMSEDDKIFEKKSFKYPLCKQGSKSMGEKIAHPDYADPQKLFNTSSNSTVNISLELSECEIMGSPEHLDMTISEKEVFSELEKRLNDSELVDVVKVEISSQNDEKTCNNSTNGSDSYYESILDKNLVEEYTQDGTGKLVAKQDSFKNFKDSIVYTKFHRVSSFKETSKTDQPRPIVKRPTNPPPPIPTKPSRFLNQNSTLISSKYEKVICNGNSVTNTKIINISKSSNNVTKLNEFNNNNDNSTDESKTERMNGNDTETPKNVGKSWVKAMVGRFE